MAKRICRTADRLDQTGMPGLCRRVWRAAPLPSPQIVSKILQRGSHALIAEEGCAGFARCSGRWPRSLPSDPGRIAPSIRPDLISGRDRYRSTLLSRGDDKTAMRIVVVMQRVHDMDLVGYLLEQGGFDVLNLPAIAQRTETYDLGGGCRAHRQ